MIYKSFSDIPDRSYRIIVVDFPWRYKSRAGGSMKSGSSAKYETMDIDDICAFPLKRISASDSMLFLWGTTPLMPEAFRAMRELGWRYATMITWRKIMSMGMGWTYRVQTEHCLVGYRGKQKALRAQRANFIQAKAGIHSAKPQEFWDLLEETLPDCLNPRMELFSRQERDGWDCWGIGVGSEPFVSAAQINAGGAA